MTADFNKPTAEDQFLDVLTEIRDNLAALAKQDLSDAQNVPEESIQYSATNRRWEKRINAVWVALSPLTQALDVKVHDSERLGDQEPAYYRNADNINAGTMDLRRLATESVNYASTNGYKLARIAVVRALYNWIRNQLSTHTHTAQQISGIFNLARIPNLPARKITSGVLAQLRIPSLPASKITSGVLDVARIPASAKVPPGTVISFASAVMPTGWLECNGRWCRLEQYEDLFAAIGTRFGGQGVGRALQFRLPDLRGEFIRGWDRSGVADPSRIFGSEQASAFKAHNHPVYISDDDAGDDGSGSGYGVAPNFSNPRIANAVPRLSVTAIGDTGDRETRPHNIALLFCIKT